MKNKGFTLIELIAVIVMMGMIILVVFPATSRLLRSNDDKKYDTYYDSVQEALEFYARTRRDELGGINGEGCVDDKKISELEEYDYISKFTEEKNVTCLSPGDFTIEQLGLLGIDTSKQYVNIRIENNKGKISVKHSMVCVRNFDQPDIMSLVYSNLIEKTSTCERYIPVIANSLFNEIKNKYTTSSSGTTKYVTGNPNNNYIWYSGNMWRIVSFNTDNKTIKLVTDDSVSILKYNNKEGTSNGLNEYNTSNIYLWLRNVFLPSLRNPEKFLYDAEWNYSAVYDATLPIVGGDTLISKVGLLNTYEYNKGASYLNKGKYFWLISPRIASPTSVAQADAWLVNNQGQPYYSHVSLYVGVRPSVVLKANIAFVNGGLGTIDNPYKLIGDNSANVGASLNGRYAGEYVTFNNTLFRISETSSKYTKITAVDVLSLDETLVNSIPNIESNNYNTIAGTMSYHFFDDKYSYNTFIGNYLELWLAPVVDKTIEGDFCRNRIEKETSQTIPCPPEDVISVKIAVPRLGELYTNPSKSIWTINRKDNSVINTIGNSSTSSGKTIDSQASILPVIVIKNSVLITGGNGTENNPYTIG